MQNIILLLKQLLIDTNIIKKFFTKKIFAIVLKLLITFIKLIFLKKFFDVVSIVKKFFAKSAMLISIFNSLILTKKQFVVVILFYTS